MRRIIFHGGWVAGLGLFCLFGGVAGCGKSKVSTGAAVQAATAQYVAPREVAPLKPSIAFQKPEHVHGIYLTAWSAGSPTKMAKVFAMFGRTELNSVVIDVRDSGEMYFDTGIELAAKAHANQHAVVHPAKMMEGLKLHHVYPIARVACFRDNFVPKQFPERAVQIGKGGVWRDRSGHSWLDPYNKKNWEYIAQTVSYALDLGFPEIQLDYVRFPSEGRASTQIFPGKKSYPDQNAKPEDVIEAFAKFIRDKVKARGAMISADIFGIISSTKGDEGIGQELEKIAGPFDLVSPMVYPSHFAKGEYGIKDPNAAPYAILVKSLRDYARRIPDKPIRPWLQDFYHYSVKDIRAQIRAAKEVGYQDYLLWNARNIYTEAAVKDNSKLVAANKIGSLRPPPDAKTDPKPATNGAKVTTKPKAAIPQNPQASSKG